MLTLPLGVTAPLSMLNAQEILQKENPFHISYQHCTKQGGSHLLFLGTSWDRGTKLRDMRVSPLIHEPHRTIMLVNEHVWL